VSQIDPVFFQKMNWVNLTQCEGYHFMTAGKVFRQTKKTRHYCRR